MATVRERAAALNLAEKLCAPRNVPGVLIKPVQPSSLWSGLISHLKTSVTVKRRRILIRSHSDCFLGSEAVDVVGTHIAQIQGFEGASVSRNRVVCVCQALLDCKVFEAVGSRVFCKDKKQDVFQDSKSSLYRFLSVDTPSIEDLERGMLGQGIQNLFCSAPSEREQEHMSPQSPLCNPCVSMQTSTPVKAGRLWEMRVENLSLSPSREHSNSVLPQSLVNEVWLEQTTLRLLKLVELPLLEGVLQCSQNYPSSSTSPCLLNRSNPDLIYSSNHLDRQILKAFSDSQKDEWLSVALDCLDFLPDQPVVELSREIPRCCPVDQHHATAGSQDEAWLPSNESDAGHDGQLTHSLDVVNKCKLLVYGTLVKHYSNTDRPPLLPQYMTDVYTAITDLLGNAKLDKALEALQLCLKLLPPSGREELRRLLLFMALAADPRGIKLEKEMENKLAVKKNFSRAILYSRALSNEQQDLMVIFMLSNGIEIFKIPGALHKVVSDKLASIEHGTQPDLSGTSFCQQVSSRTCADSTKKTTDGELWALLNNIHLDPKLSTKERKRLLGLFYQAHPEVFNHYFGDFAPSVL